MSKGVELKRVVLDTTALIFLNDFSVFDQAYTVQEVIEEVKDKMTSMKLATLTKNLKTMEPEQRFVDEVKKAAEETGDVAKLSCTDIKVLALTKQLNCVVVSDDYAIQNVASHIDVKYASVFSPNIKKLIKWRRGEKGDDQKL